MRQKNMMEFITLLYHMTKFLCYVIICRSLLRYESVN